MYVRSLSEHQFGMISSFEEVRCMPKSVSVKRHNRSTPKSPAYKGTGKKPGPKPVAVRQHKRSTPKK
jgi:hypothetical protein